MITLTKVLNAVGLISFSLIIVSTIILMTPIQFQLIYSQPIESYITFLKDTEEVPPTNTTSIGIAKFIVDYNLTQIKYLINVTNIENVTAAHIHYGNSGENGPVVVTLLKSDQPSGMITGLLSSGNITSTDLQGQLKDKQISDLVQIMKNGSAYVNIHTEQNPNGEIRGQLASWLRNMS